jgi:hypothetical protein
MIFINNTLQLLNRVRCQRNLYKDMILHFKQNHYAFRHLGCNISNPTMRTGQDFKSAQFDKKISQLR